MEIDGESSHHLKKLMARQVLILLCLIHHVLCQQCSDIERLYGSNLALGKETVQSSTYSDMNFNYSSNLAVDGDISTVWSEKSCSHTGVNGPRPAWWSVDIEEERILRKIVIFNRADLTERLIGASVIGYASNGTQFEIKGSLPGSAKIELDVKTLNPIRNVTIVLPINSRDNIINICEVQLFENLNIARGKSTYQSSDYSDGSKRFDASLAVDGNESSEFSDGSCTATNNSDGLYTPTLQNVSWSVNLGREYLISYIKIFNREDAELNHFSRRLGHFTIMGTNRINRSILLYHEERDDPGKEISIPLYTNITVPVSIISVSIPRVQGGNNVLTICEFEAYRAIECPIYRLENGNIRVQKYGDNERNYTLCATLVLNCNQGYKLYQVGLQSITTTCQINRTWTTMVHCEDINECSAGDDVCNNNGNCTNNPGSFKCECHEGYNGKTCNEVIRCDELFQPNNSNITVYGGINGTWTYNTTVSISCTEGYILYGESLVLCEGSNQWTGSIGQCDKRADAFNSLESGTTAGSIAGGSAGGVGVVVLGILIGVILYRRKIRPQAKAAETAFDDLPSSSKNMTYEEMGSKQNVIYDEPMESKYHVSREADHVYKNIGGSSGDYYSHQPQNTKDKHTIHLEDLSSFFLSRKLEPQMFEEEYNTLPQGLLKPHYTALLPENRKKNRYKNMYAYDDTRVQLDIWDPVTETDYINACYVKGFKDSSIIIASQGPTKNILNDFWRMIWQTNSRKIVMLTNLIEEEKHKCEKYWPDEGSTKFGFITIRLVNIERFSDFTIRTLELKKEHFVKEKRKLQPRLVQQFHFTAWPDKGVPRYASSLVHFHHKVRNTRVQGTTEDLMIVHCSAGIGRTGTFLALDYLVDEGKELNYINIFRCVETLRQQRVNLVQNVDQYVFLHEALVEALSCITSAMSASSFRVEYTKLFEIDNKTRKRRLDLQYEELPMYVAEAKDDVYENAKSMENQGKNRYSNILPDQNHSPYLNVDVEGCETYINAVFLPAYKENDIFIITQTPLEDTKVDFWRMVYQFDVSSVVMLNTLKEMKDEERYWPENEESLQIPPFSIALENKSVDEICVNYTLLLQYHDDHRKVRLSRATYWADTEPVPMSPTAMLKQIQLIQSWQQEKGNKPIVVHCMNGAERSGLFCVIAALLERTKIEQDVAVEHIIKQMRSRRPQIITNVDQFKFCFDAMRAFLDQYQEYSNFTQH